MAREGEVRERRSEGDGNGGWVVEGGEGGRGKGCRSATEAGVGWCRERKGRGAEAVFATEPRVCDVEESAGRRHRVREAKSGQQRSDNSGGDQHVQR
eukprot:3940669-Rhodomonas_salina.9